VIEREPAAPGGDEYPRPPRSVIGADDAPSPSRPTNKLHQRAEVMLLWKRRLRKCSNDLSAWAAPRRGAIAALP